MNLDDLLESERERGGFSAAQRDAIWRGVTRTIAGAGAAVVVTGAAAAAPAASAASSTAMASSGGKLVAWKLAALLSAAVLGGAGMGAAAHARWSDPKIVQVEVVKAAPLKLASSSESASAPAPSSVSTLALSVDALPSAAPDASAAPVAAGSRAEPSTGASAARAPKDPALARERTLLDMARTALSRGDARGALASLDTHTREFPSSQLTQEREVLAVQALASASRMPEARQRAALFRARFPTSPLLPVIDEATE